MKVSSGGSIAFVFSLLSLQSPLQSPCSTSNPSSPVADRSLVLVPSPHAALQGPQSDQFCQLRLTSVPPLDLLLRHVPGTPLQAPGCEQQAGKAVWSTMHSSPRHSRPLAHKPAPLVSVDHSQAPPSSLAHSWQTEAQMVMLTSSPERQVDASSAQGVSRNLALEATFVNHNFSQQVLKSDGDRFKFDMENPFVDAEEEGEVASVAYRYRRWDLGNNLVLVCRCELDAVQQGSDGELQFVNLKALNEWDSRHSGGVDWRQKLDTQRGAVLANELKNNACKLAKWTVQSILAGADNLKFGYVTRYNVKDSSRHVILGTQKFNPVEFGQQINLNMDNAWGVVRCILDLIMAQKDGKYLIVKDPNKPILRLYDIPDTTFESEEESGESEEDTDAIDTPLRA